MDDILSGMDNHTIRSISDNLFGPGGILRKQGSTIFLATHNRKWNLEIMYFGRALINSLQEG